MLLSVKDHIKGCRLWKGKWIIFFSLLTGHASSQHYNFRNFNTEQGLAQSYVYTILQDSRSYLWVGTGNGLSKFNGFVFENYSTNDSLADNFITCGMNDGDGLWFGHMNGRLSYFYRERFQAVDIPQSGLSPVTHFAKSADGQVWASTYADGLMKLSKEKGVIKQYRYADQVSMVTFDFLSESEMLVGTSSGLLHCRLKETGEIEIIGRVLEIPESKITGIQKMRSQSGFYIATENEGIFQLSQQGTQFKITPIISGRDTDFTGVQRIFEDSRLNLWVCTFGNGLIRMALSSSGEINKIQYLNHDHGFVSSNVKTVYEDREGNIWSGNYGEGFTQVTPKTFSILTFDKLLYGSHIFSMYFDQQWRWIGTEKGLLKTDRLTGKIHKFYGTGSGLLKDTVTAIYSVDGKDLWIGTDKNGVFRLEVMKDKIRKYPIGNGILENSITGITGKGEQIWIGTKKGLCRINHVTGVISWYSISQGGLPHNFVNGLYMDKKDRLWVSTRSNILSYIQDEMVKKIPLYTASGVLTLGPITEDEDSRIWVGSNGNGVFMIGADSITHVTVKEGLLSDYCYSLICDRNKSIWVGHKEGLSKIRTTDFSIKPIHHLGDIADIYQFNPNAIGKDQQDKIWFGSDQGLISYDPSMEYPVFLPPFLSITSITINDEKRDFHDKIVLPPGYYKIRIEYLGISLKEPSLVTYQYKLEGYDQWSDIVRSTSVTYNHVTEGEYTFILNASSGDGAVSEIPLTLTIIIKKPVWKKWWFYGINVLLLTMLVILYIKRREHNFRIEKRILEEKVMRRTNEIQCQKNEIELQRDLIDKKNAHITASILYASNIQMAVMPPLELLDRLLPDNFIMSKPKDIVSGDFYWLTEKDGKIVFTVADCTGHGVPGAFMSLLGITLLNEIVNVQGITQSDDIVTGLRDRVIQSLQQSRKDITTSDGMDIALCVMDSNQKRIQYTGAMNDLVYIRDGKLEVVKADHLSVSFTYEDNGSFTRKEIDYRKGDVFYLFSDGYQDQFGGMQDRKFLSRRLYATLLEIHQLPMIRQKEILEIRLHEWMNDHVQTDDITVMGVRL